MQNTFKRVKVYLPTTAWDTGASIDLSSAVDWWHSPNGFSAALSTGFKKTGGNILTPTIVGADGGFNDNGANALFTWTNSTTGAGSSNFAHGSTTQTLGNGFQITCPMPRWPDWRRLRVWFYSQNPNQVNYSATTDDTDAVDHAEAVGGGNELNNGVINMGSIRVDVRFASDRAGKTLTFKALRAGGTSMGYFGLAAAAVYEDGPTQGVNRSSALWRLMGVDGVLGSR